MNDKQDKDIAERWQLRNIDEVSMSEGELIDVLATGITQCESFCKSRYLCGDDSCRCIRSVFPHPAYYAEYQKLCELKDKVVAYLTLHKIGE